MSLLSRYEAWLRHFAGDQIPSEEERQLLPTNFDYWTYFLDKFREEMGYTEERPRIHHNDS
jgi:uncharacterized protein YeaO (DUF488 family)